MTTTATARIAGAAARSAAAAAAIVVVAAGPAFVPFPLFVLLPLLLLFPCCSFALAWGRDVVSHLVPALLVDSSALVAALLCIFVLRSHMRVTCLRSRVSV